MQVLDKEINDEISEFVTIKKLVEWLNTKNGGKWKPYCYGFTTLKDVVHLDAPGSLTHIEKLKRMIRCRVIPIIAWYQRSPEDFAQHFEDELRKARSKSDKEFQQVYERLQKDYLNTTLEDTDTVSALRNTLAGPQTPTILGRQSLIASMGSMSLSDSETRSDDEECEQFASVISTP